MGASYPAAHAVTRRPRSIVMLRARPCLAVPPPRYRTPTFGLWARRAIGLLHPASHCDQTVPARRPRSCSVAIDAEG